MCVCGMARSFSNAPILGSPVCVRVCGRETVSVSECVCVVCVWERERSCVCVVLHEASEMRLFGGHRCVCVCV